MTLFPEAEIALAGHGKRIAAVLLDAVFYAVFHGIGAAVGFGIGLAVGAEAAPDDSDGWEQLGWILLGMFAGMFVAFLVWCALTVWLVRRPGARNGQTLGKQIVGIRVVRTDGAPVAAGLAFGRELGAKWVLIAIAASVISAFMGFLDAGVLGLVVAFAIWYVPAFIDDERRALHDRICRTRVADAKPAAVPAAQPADDDLWPATT